jgi:hypothetical protein
MNMRTRVKDVRVALRALLATGAVALLVSACGGGNQPSAGAQHNSATTHQSTPTSAASAGIPQHNGGDQDADNNGGPSDGDGDI